MESEHDEDSDYLKSDDPTDSEENLSSDLASVVDNSVVKQENTKTRKQLTCRVCDYTFTTKKLLDAHVERNNCSKKCHVCSKTFSCARAALKHTRDVHSMSRDYECDRCDKAFKVKVHLLRHINRVHLRILNFACEICENRFFTPQALAVHVNEVHKKLKNFPCSYCDKTFGRKVLQRRPRRKDPGKEETLQVPCLQTEMCSKRDPHASHETVSPEE